MIFIVSWCYGGLAMVIFILFWQGSYPPWWHHTGIMFLSDIWIHLEYLEHDTSKAKMCYHFCSKQCFSSETPIPEDMWKL